MNWLVRLVKESRRRFSPNDKVRYFVENRKGKGRGIVLTPNFSKGTVVDFDPAARRYKVKNDSGEQIEVHPRNLAYDSIPRSSPAVTPSVVPSPSELI